MRGEKKITENELLSDPTLKQSGRGVRWKEGVLSGQKQDPSRVGGGCFCKAALVTASKGSGRARFRPQSPCTCCLGRAPLRLLIYLRPELTFLPFLTCIFFSKATNL